MHYGELRPLIVSLCPFDVKPCMPEGMNIVDAEEKQNGPRPDCTLDVVCSVKSRP